MHIGIPVRKYMRMIGEITEQKGTIKVTFYAYTSHTPIIVNNAPDIYVCI